MDKNPGNAENVVGIALASWLTSGDPDGTYSMNSLAYAMGAFPKTWYEKDGGIIYGSTTEEMKNALSTAAGWYRDGILDPQVGTSCLLYTSGMIVSHIFAMKLKIFLPSMTI